MGLWQKVKQYFSLPSMTDPVFGEIGFMYISNAPENSYWECEDWIFPATNKKVGIVLPGDEHGPFPEAREFYLSLSDRYDSILAAVLPKLREVLEQWTEYLKEELQEDVFQHVELAGFGLEIPIEDPMRWDVGFETTGQRWLCVTIPFIGDVPQTPIVDT